MDAILIFPRIPLVSPIVAAHLVFYGEHGVKGRRCINAWVKPDCGRKDKVQRRISWAKKELALWALD